MSGGRGGARAMPHVGGGGAWPPLAGTGARKKTTPAATVTSQQGQETTDTNVRVDQLLASARAAASTKQNTKDAEQRRTNERIRGEDRDGAAGPNPVDQGASGGTAPDLI